MKRTQNRAIRRQQLIEATIATIAERGLSDTTLATVSKRAGLSHGIINFHFKSKEMLLAETLGFLAREHYDLWFTAMKAGEPDSAEQLTAIVEADFKESVCSLEKLAVWFSFWGQVKYRPAYLEAHNEFDILRSAELKRLCEEIIAEGSYEHIDATAAARRIEALIDGLWLNMLLYPQKVSRIEARDDVLDCLAELFPSHFLRPVRADCRLGPNRYERFEQKVSG